MSDEGLGPVDVTGRWVGFYRHRWEELGIYPIVADLEHSGSQLTGTMYDQVTDRWESVEHFLDMAGEDIATETRQRLQQMMSRFGPEIVWNARLPDTSDIRGKVAGSHVRLTRLTEEQWRLP